MGSAIWKEGNSARAAVEWTHSTHSTDGRTDRQAGTLHCSHTRTWGRTRSLAHRCVTQGGRRPPRREQHEET